MDRFGDENYKRTSEIITKDTQFNEGTEKVIALKK
jgi:hypothetical protein